MLLRVTANDIAVGSSSMVSSISSPNAVRYRHARKVPRHAELICNASDHWPTTSNFRPNHR